LLDLAQEFPYLVKSFSFFGHGSGRVVKADFWIEGTTRQVRYR